MRPHAILLPLILFLITAAATLQAQPAGSAGQSAPVSTDAVHSTLISSHQTITAGQRFQVAWDITLDPHWHVYWKNPGDSGLAPQLEPQNGFTATPLEFPSPKVISIPPVTNYGFENRAILLTTVTAPATLAPGIYNLPVKLTYLYCSDVCMPGEVTALLPLKVALTAQANPAFAPVMQAHQAALPKPLPAGADIRAAVSGASINLYFNPAAFGTVMTARFIPDTESWLHDSAEQPYAKGTLTLAQDPYQKTTPSTITGLLLINGTDTYILNVPLPALTQASAPPPPEQAQPGDTTLGLALFFGFLAGLILNVMPCVLPVLSLKILSLVRHHSSAYRRRHTLAYTFGVLVSFWSFAVVIVGLQSGGQQLGWGFHLQNPLFVAALATLMLAVALNFFGLFTVGESLTRLTAAPNTTPHPKETLFSDVATGVLAVVVATPCTVPFMGGALAYALGQPLAVSLMVFTAIGLGMASPFLLAAIHPRLLSWLPHPGRWMLTFKHLLGWPMLATGLWLVWVFTNQTSLAAGFLLLLLMLGLAFSLWLYGTRPRHITLALVLFTLVAGGWLLAPMGSVSQATPSPEISANGWQPWSLQAQQEAIARGKPVFVDFTADWCLTCKVTEATVLNTTTVKTMLNQNGVTLLQGDWTRQDPAITAELARHGRKGVPLYLAYLPGQASPTILPQLLTPSLLEETFRRQP